MYNDICEVSQSNRDLRTYVWIVDLCMYICSVVHDGTEIAGIGVGVCQLTFYHFNAL